MTLTVSVGELLAFAFKSEDTLGFPPPRDLALARSATIMPPLNDRTSDKHASSATRRQRLIPGMLKTLETIMPYDIKACCTLLIARGVGLKFFISFPILILLIISDSL